MYKVYCVGYDLNKAGKDYDGLIKELKKSSSWWHYLDSTWLIYTQETPEQIWARISSHFDKNDYALIIRVARDYQGWLPKEAWDWINKHV